MPESEILDESQAVQQTSSPEASPKESSNAEDQSKESAPPPDTLDPDKKPHPLEPEGERFKQVWARGKKAEERAASLDAELQHEREERIRLEERLKARDATSTPEYSWEQLRAAVDAGTITEAKAFEIHDAQLYARWKRDLDARDAESHQLSNIVIEMNEYVRLVPNAIVPGTEERLKVEREYGYLVQRLGTPVSKVQKHSMELAAARAAFGDVDTLKTKASLASKPLTRESYMETSTTNQQKASAAIKKSFKDTLTSREVEHYERMMRRGSYPGGWAEVEKEHAEYEVYQKELATQRARVTK